MRELVCWSSPYPLSCYVPADPDRARSRDAGDRSCATCCGTNRAVIRVDQAIRYHAGRGAAVGYNPRYAGPVNDLLRNRPAGDGVRIRRRPRRAAGPAGPEGRLARP